MIVMVLRMVVRIRFTLVMKYINVRALCVKITTKVNDL